ncbi:MAG: DPP IV N-terminal domain-containing protein, partial [Acidobacteriota bacterium]
MTSRSGIRRLSVLWATALVLVAGYAGAQTTPAAPALLSLDRIFASRDFATERFGPARWMTAGDSYTTLEPAAGGGPGRDLVLYRAESGQREILVAAAKLVPPGSSAPLAIEDYAWSPDGKVLIVMTNSRRVWRQNTRGDFWTYDLASGRLRKLGPGFEPSTLMFAKLSPDGRMAGYVVKNNIYVENLADGHVRALTTDGTGDIINGTSDWVNEEEFGIRDGFRWSPDSRLIAFWQFDTHGVPVFTMINNTDATYPATVSFKHPKAGQPNSAVRVGVVPAAGGPTVWMKAPGDPHDIYIPLIDWAGNARDVIFQQLNRLQNTNHVQLGDAATGEIRTIFVDKDEAWLDDMTRYVWLAGGKGLFWLSERDGWRHAYYVSRDGKEVRLMTPGDYDVMSVDAIDEKAGLLYITASPDNATTRFEYRVRMDGTGQPERVGPAGQTGVHRYDVSPTARWAFHSFSTLDTPPQTELVRLPGGETVRPLAPNAALRASVDALTRQRVEYTKLDIGSGIQVDSWRILPPNFDP